MEDPFDLEHNPGDRPKPEFDKEIRYIKDEFINSSKLIKEGNLSELFEKKIKN